MKIDDCPYWLDFPSNSTLSLSGLYRYEVHWNDGTVRRGKVDVDKLQAATMYDESVKFTIQK